MSKSRSVGTVLNINSKKVGALKSIGGIELSADTIDVSDLGNSTGYREFLQGFKDAGEIALSGFYDGDDEGFFERTPDMVFALERKEVGSKVKQLPVIRNK